MQNVSNATTGKKEKTILILKNVFHLPPIPKVMQEALKLIDSKNFNNQELGKIISRDLSLVTKILTIANSPMYGLQRRVTSIDFAILILGYSELRNIISILSMSEAFKNKTDKYMDQKAFWLHSFLVGSASKRLSEEIEYYNKGEAFVGGFLHDVGFSVMHRYFHSNFVEIRELVNSNQMSFREAEIEVLGMDHQEIGFYLLEHWNFPLEICNAVLHHHCPAEASQDDKLLSVVINFADYMTQKLALGNLSFEMEPRADNEVYLTFGFKSDEELDKFVESYRELFENQIESVKYLN